MSNTHHIGLVIAALAVTFNFAAAAQTVTVTEPAAAVQVESGAVVAQPLSITQRYVPAGSPVRKTGAPLQLLVDDSQTQTAQPAPLVVANEVGADEVGAQPAINALRPGRFAITVSQVSRER